MIFLYSYIPGTHHLFLQTDFTDYSPCACSCGSSGVSIIPDTCAALPFLCHERSKNCQNSLSVMLRLLSVIGTVQCAVPTYKTHLEAKFFQIFWEFFTGGDCGVVLILGLYGSRSFDCSLFSHSLRIKSAEGGFGGPGLYQFVIRLRSVPISKYSLLNTLIYTRN